jgi:hypothetical protein
VGARAFSLCSHFPSAKRHHPHRFLVVFGVMCPPEYVWLG